MTVVIPTFGREKVLVETLQAVFRLDPEELIVVDQTREHDPETRTFLQEQDESRRLRWELLLEPSIPCAMNTGVLLARSDIVLFLDDDIEPSGELLTMHARAHAEYPEAFAVVGQVLQPGENPSDLRPGDHFRFNSAAPAWIESAMAGNLSVKRLRFLEVGGFDENFVKVAYCFETEFAERVIRAGGKVFFEPRASIRHLRAERGGTRTHGSHLTTASSAHSVGAYYHLLLRQGVVRAIPGAANRMLRSVATRHHLRRPWWIPATLLGEVRGLVQSFALFRRGPQLLKP